MQVFSIIALSILAAVIYGILHDQVTARICVEYFTIGHARLILSESPTVLGLFWGVVATWWVGLPLGIGLAVAARTGKRPKLAAAGLVRPLSKLLLWMYAFAFLAGVVGYITARTGIFHLVEPFASRVPASKHTAFLICGWSHAASYLAGVAGGIFLWISTWRRRGRLAAVPQ